MSDVSADELRELLEFLQEMNAEAQTQAKNELLPPILRSHSYGMADGLEIAAKSVDQILNRAQVNAAPPPMHVDSGSNAKPDVLGKIAHELRSPLTSILGFSSTLLADDLHFDQNAQRQFLEIIDTEAQRMARYLDSLMDWSRLQDGSISFTFEDQSFAVIAAEVEPQLRTLATEHALQLEVAQELPPVKVDKRRVEQVLINLVVNAVMYTPTGTPILISAQVDHDFVQVIVADQGAGIPVEARETVFEPYHPLVTHGKSRRKGLGLGLPLSKAFVEKHGGTLWIEDNEQGGTKMAFTLPVAQPVLSDQGVSSSA